MIATIIAATVIILALAVVVWFAIVEPIFVHQPYYLKHGCAPRAWNSAGMPTIWRCPPGTPQAPL
jgi:hypothetical protein